MPIQHWSDAILILELQAGSEMTDELNSLARYVAEREKYNVVVDFTDVGEITSASLSRLLRLRKLTAEGGGRLVLCNIAPDTEDVLAVTGLSDVFELTRDRFTALATLEMIG